MPERMLTADEFGRIPEYLLPIETLDRMDDMSGAAMFSAEVKQIEFLSREAQASYVAAARAGDTNAQHALILNCLNRTITKGASIYRDKQPEHSGLPDLLGHAHVQMLEAMPRALKARDPVRYLMSVGELEMRIYCFYLDPLIRRPNWRPATYPHPDTVSIEQQPRLRAVPEAAQPERDPLDDPAMRVVYDALAGMSRRKREVLLYAYGLNGAPTMRVGEIAETLGLSKKVVENYLARGKRDLARKLGPFLGELGLL